MKIKLDKDWKSKIIGKFYDDFEEIQLGKTYRSDQNNKKILSKYLIEVISHIIALEER